MFNRKELKERAKFSLQGSYWKAFLVSFVLAIVGGGCNFSSARSNFSFNINSPDFSFSGTGANELWLATFLPLLIASAFVAFLISFAFRIFIIAPLETGGMSYFKYSTDGHHDVGMLAYSFKSGRYWSIVKAMFWRDLLLFLWFLLLIIPGIIKRFLTAWFPLFFRITRILA